LTYSLVKRLCNHYVIISTGNKFMKHKADSTYHSSSLPLMRNNTSNISK